MLDRQYGLTPGPKQLRTIENLLSYDNKMKPTSTFKIQTTCISCVCLYTTRKLNYVHIPVFNTRGGDNHSLQVFFFFEGILYKL